jgi:hypothetical protein
MTMRNISKYSILGLFLVLLGLASCDMLRTAEQDAMPVVEPNDTYPVITSFTMDNTGTITEGDTITYTLKINKPIDRSLTFTPVVLSGTKLVEHDDFDILGPVTIAPWETEGKLVVYTYADTNPEEAKNLVITFKMNSLAEKYLVHPNNVFPEITTSVTNYKSPNLILEFYWAKDIDLGPDGVYSTSNNVDFDAIISTAEGFDINDPWATDVGIYQGATGNHPEVIELAPGMLEDGEYIIWFDLWSNAFAGYGNTTLIPVTTLAYQIGTDLEEEIAQDPSGIINADIPGADDDDGYASNAILVKLKVEGSKFTLSDYKDVVIGSTKSGQPKTLRPAIDKQAKAKGLVPMN